MNTLRNRLIAVGTDAARTKPNRLTFAIWVAASTVAAVAAIVNPLAGVALALAGGVVLGLAALSGSDRRPRRMNLGPIPAGRYRGYVRRMAGWVDRHELALLVALAPLFLFPAPAWAPVVLLVPLVWLARLMACGYVTRSSPLTVPVGILFTLAVPALWLAPNTAVAWPKFAGLVYGVGLYFAILNLKARLSTAVFTSLAALGTLLISVIALVGTEWPDSKLRFYEAVYRSLPVLISNISHSLKGGINANEVGGVMCWLLPLQVGLWVAYGGRGEGVSGPWRGRAAFLWRGLLLAAIVLASGVLFMTQSRTAIAAVTVSLLFLGALRLRFLSDRPRWVAAAVMATLGAASLGLFVAGAAMISSSPGQFAATQRVYFWLIALQLIHNQPLAGIGLNQFDLVRIPLSAQMAPGLAAVGVHAHNLFLQVALDLGLPGLTAYVGLATAALGTLLLTARRLAEARGLAMALCAGLLAHQLFGLTDAITLGARPGFIFWTFLGLAARLAWHARAAEGTPA